MHRACVTAAVVLVPHLAAAELLDRPRFDYFHMTASTEVGKDKGAALTLHVQASTECGCHFSFYGTLPVSLDLRDTPQVIAAGGPVAPENPTALGTADVGVYGGTDSDGVATLFRVGALLPTGTRTPHDSLPSARAGDRALELGRSAGVRLSTSRLWSTPSAKEWRVDAGIDVSEELATSGHPVHVIPRGGVGVHLPLADNLGLGVESALSLDPFFEDDVRWGTGITVDYTRWTYVRPAVTLAAVRANDGWGASVLVDLTASSRRH
jgi:hypothetical protein